MTKNTKRHFKMMKGFNLRAEIVSTQLKCKAKLIFNVIPTRHVIQRKRESINYSKH